MQQMQIQGTEIQIKEYQGKRVVTLKDVDAVHQRKPGTASRNFRENRMHFIDGVDFYKINQPDEIRRLGISRPQGGTANEVTLPLLICWYTQMLTVAINLLPLLKRFFRKLLKQLFRKN